MKNKFNLLLFLAIIFAHPAHIHAQCLNDSNIYSFQYNGHTYEMAKEKKTWANAAACAVERGGYLAEITDAAEQDTIFFELIQHANINYANTKNIFGTSSIWIGGSDAVTEGNWIWDGNNDGLGPQFWSGGSNGSPVGGSYTKWGTSPAEPDNSGGQDHLTLIIDSTRINFGRWNDLNASDNLFFLIERNTGVSSSSEIADVAIAIYPNPFQDKIFIKHDGQAKITQISIVNAMGQRVKSFQVIENVAAALNVSDLGVGLYFVTIHFETGEKLGKKLMKSRF